MDEEVRGRLRKRGPYVRQRESQTLEFKEQFNYTALAEYLRDFAAFANNRGGYLVFGVKDSPRVPAGLSANSLNQFERIDTERITGHILECFSHFIEWEMAVIDLYEVQFGVIRINEAQQKPVIAKKDSGNGQEIRLGDIYYRYGGRTQRILPSDLERIIQDRINAANRSWQAQMNRLARIGPENTAIMDTKSGTIEQDAGRTIVIDEMLAERLRFIKEGEFSEREGEPTLKLVGKVVPVEDIDHLHAVEVPSIEKYPLSATELAAEIKAQLPWVGRNQIWNAIAEHGLKDNQDYSCYNFRTKKQRDEYLQRGILPKAIASIYNREAVDFLVSHFRRMVDPR